MISFLIASFVIDPARSPAHSQAALTKCCSAISSIQGEINRCVRSWKLRILSGKRRTVSSAGKHKQKCTMLGASDPFGENYRKLHLLANINRNVQRWATILGALDPSSKKVLIATTACKNMLNFTGVSNLGHLEHFGKRKENCICS